MEGKCSPIHVMLLDHKAVLPYSLSYETQIALYKTSSVLSLESTVEGEWVGNRQTKSIHCIKLSHSLILVKPVIHETNLYTLTLLNIMVTFHSRSWVTSYIPWMIKGWPLLLSRDRQSYESLKGIY